MNECSPEKLLQAAKQLIGKTIGELDTAGWLLETKNKGAIGQIIEKKLTGQWRNNNPEADVPGMEIKVTGLKKLKTGAYSARDRLVLTNMNPFMVVKEMFEESHVYKKCNCMLVIFYIIEKDRSDCKIACAHLFDLKKNEHYEDIKRDFYTNKKKVEDGQAHLISGKTTKYLTTCQKQVAMQKQPFSDKLVKMRAWALPRWFVHKYIFLACNNVNENGFIT